MQVTSAISLCNSSLKCSIHSEDGSICDDVDYHISQADCCQNFNVIKVSHEEIIYLLCQDVQKLTKDQWY